MAITQNQSIKAKDINDKFRINYLKTALYSKITPGEKVYSLTYNGITAVDNGDGTYTFNGTCDSSNEALFAFSPYNIKNNYIGYKLIGNVAGGSGGTFRLTCAYFNDDNIQTSINFDSGDGIIIQDSSKIQISFVVRPNITVNNMVIKPMITDDLSATYSDFVSWENSNTTNKQIIELMNQLYPIGSIYINQNDICSPKVLIPNSVWEKLPEGYALWTSTSGAGSTIAPGLPNLTGYEGNVYRAKVSTSNTNQAFRSESAYGHEINIGSGGETVINQGFVFNANSQNSIYRDDVNTVQPPAYRIYAWRRIG